MVKEKLFCVLAIICCCQFGFAQWQQKGNYRYPSNNSSSIEAHFGTCVDLSADGNVFAVASPLFNDTSQIRVYQWAGYWQKKGEWIDLSWTPWEFKTGVSISASGNTFAATFFDPLNADKICIVYDYDGDDWSMRGDPIIDEEPGYFNQGKSVELTPDGNTVVLSSQSDGPGNEMVRIFDWVETVWVERISVPTGSLANQGFNCSVSDGAGSISIATAGSFCEDGTASEPWNVKVYDWTGADWVLRGFGISEPDGNHCGIYTALSIDGNTVAVSTPPYVRIYDWTGGFWTQRSNAIITETTGYGTEGFIVSNPVDISWDGNIFAVGIPLNDSGRGEVKVYSWTGTGWLRLGEDLVGTEVNDYFGYSVALSANGLTVAAGEPGCDSIEVDAGRAMVYKYAFTSGVNEISVDDEFDIWPNPTSGLVAFSQAVSELKIFNSFGQLLLKTSNVESLDLSEFPSGLYILQADGKVMRIVKR